jgi:hypothetical protein
MNTTMVSPMARDAARISAATMPDTAAGNTIRSVVDIRRAPTPADASRRLLGTARMASSETEATSGIVRMPTPMPAAIMLPLLCSAPKMRPTTSGAIQLSANTPSTTDGMPASTSRIGLSTVRTRGWAYSDR